MATLVSEIIESARIRHWSFTDVELGDGAALLFLNTKLRAIVLRNLTGMRSLLTATVQTSANATGVLLSLTRDGVPYWDGSGADGYAVAVDEDGVPYIDTNSVPLSTDPFGLSGGKPGIALPRDVIALITCNAIGTDGVVRPIEVLEANARQQSPQGRDLTVVLTGNRLVPLRKPGVTTDWWNSVASIRVSYIPLPQLTALSDPIALATVREDAYALALDGDGVPYLDTASATAIVQDPFGGQVSDVATMTALADVLIADTAELFALQSQKCPPADRRAFSDAARRAEAEFDKMATDILGEFITTSVIFTG